MQNIKQLGIWMDHASAHVMEFTGVPIKTVIIKSEFTHNDKQESLNKSERLMHNKEQHEVANYYKDLGEIIKNYNEVIVFGATDASQELINYLKGNHLFEKIKIEVKHSDYMTNNEEQAYVRNYFTK